MIDWEKVDWSKSNSALAKQLKVSPGLISRKRGEYAPHTQKWRWQGGTGTIDWRHVDWGLSNPQLRKLTRVANIAHLRERFAPETIKRRRQRQFCKIGQRSCIMTNDTCGFSGSGCGFSGSGCSYS